MLGRTLHVKDPKPCERRIDSVSIFDSVSPPRLVKGCSRGLFRRIDDGHPTESASADPLAVVLPRPWPRDQRNAARNTLVDSVVSRSSDHDIRRTIEFHRGPVRNPVFPGTSARARGRDAAHVVILEAANHFAVPVEFLSIACGTHEDVQTAFIQ